MDVAKYLGLFLLKNQYCYIHGLGNLELRKRAATYDGKALQASSYEVVLTPGGSIDDNFANFIATNEQISISKAANALRDYSTQARKDIEEGREVVVPNLGKFVGDNGRIRFITDENFHYTPPGVPTVRNSKQLEEQNARPIHKPSYPPPSRADSVNWSMVIIVVVLLLILGGGIYGIYYYMNSNKESEQAASPVPVKDTVVHAQTQPLPAPVDTTQHKDTMAATAPAPASIQPQPAVNDTSRNAYKMIIGYYKTKERADFRLNTLKTNGNKVEIMQRDSSGFFITTTIHCRPQDTVHVEDSLRRMFGYKGVSIVK
jgi:nucleoid DNA-binding protein/flagellar basal body-associated protein FliL